MIIVDDRLALDALAGTLEHHDPDGVATTWAFHYRLLRAVASDGAGALTRAATDDVRHLTASPPPERLVVLDPRAATAIAARLAARYRLNLLAAELVGAAVVHEATVWLSTPNVGREVARGDGCRGRAARGCQRRLRRPWLTAALHPLRAARSHGVARTVPAAAGREGTRPDRAGSTPSTSSTGTTTPTSRLPTPPRSRWRRSSTCSTSRRAGRRVSTSPASVAR